MEIKKAKEILQLLADGIDPATGELLPDESPYNKPEVIRALFAVLAEPTKRPHQNAGLPWSETEDEQLSQEFAAGLRVSAIAKEHGRTRGAITSRIKHLEL